MDLRTTSGSKIKFEGLSRNKGVVWVVWEDRKTHMLISDLDEPSQEKVNGLLAEELEKENKL